MWGGFQALPGRSRGLQGPRGGSASSRSRLYSLVPGFGEEAGAAAALLSGVLLPVGGAAGPEPLPVVVEGGGVAGLRRACKGE